MSEQAPVELHPYRDPHGEAVQYESHPWYYRKGAVRAVLLAEIFCSAVILVGGVWAPTVLFMLLVASGVYAVGAAIAMVALLRRMSQRQPTRDEALVAWLLLVPCVLLTAAVVVVGLTTESPFV